MIGNSGGEAVVLTSSRSDFPKEPFPVTFNLPQILLSCISLSSLFFFCCDTTFHPLFHLLFYFPRLALHWERCLIMFSPDKWEVLSEINSVLCITIICFFLGRKFSSQQGPAHYARILVLALFSVSWAFNLISTLLVSTNNNNITSCSLSIFMCITLYALSKILIYLFLIEKASYSIDMCLFFF
jgi:hypothetical protein